MSSIGSIGSASSYMAGMRSLQRPDPEKMAQNLFAKLDTSGQGYIDKTGLQQAFDKVGASGDASAAATVDELFSQLDGDSDGKVTQQEFSDGVSKLAEQLDSQFQSMRMQGGMPPPPPPQGGQDDAGFTKDELSSQLEEIGSTDSKRSSLISNIVSNFDKADTDGDGKVSLSEAMAYDQSSNASGSSSSSSSASASTTSGSDSSSASVNDLNARAMMQVMRLMHAYGLDGSAVASASSGLSVSA